MSTAASSTPAAPVAQVPAAPATRWPPGRILVALLIPTYLGLIFDLRVEHVEAVRDNTFAWLPIAYCTLSSPILLAAVIFWNRITRWVLLPVFLLGFALAGAGIYFHNIHHTNQVIPDFTHAWSDPEMELPKSPPHAAPFAFAAFSVLGTLATLKRFN